MTDETGRLMNFRGFPPQALPFFKALAFHQTESEDSDQGRPKVVAFPHPPRRALLEEQGSLQD
jgi:hypothetical protein